METLTRPENQESPAPLVPTSLETGLVETRGRAPTEIWWCADLIDMKLAIGAIVALVIIVGAAYMLSSGGGGETTNQTTNQTTSGGTEAGGETGGETGTSGSTGTSGGSTADLTGEWEGTYTSNYGSGQWWMTIQESGGSYVGCLKLAGPYNSTDYFGVQISVNGDQVTIQFPPYIPVQVTATVSGDTISGTWSSTDPQHPDSGTWEGTRTSTTVTSMPCLGEGTTSGGETNETTGGETGSNETTTNETQPVTPASIAAGIAQYVLTEAGVQDEAILVSNISQTVPSPYGMLQGVQLVYNVSGDAFNVSTRADLVNTITQYLASQGYMIVSTTTPTNADPFLDIIAAKMSGTSVTYVEITIDSTYPPYTQFTISVGINA